MSTLVTLLDQLICCLVMEPYGSRSPLHNSVQMCVDATVIQKLLISLGLVAKHFDTVLFFTTMLKGAQGHHWEAGYTSPIPDGLQ